MDDLEAQLNEIESALDNLESQNDNIHIKLKELLESNREIRKEMVEMGMLLTATANEEEELLASSATKTTENVNDLTAELPQLQKMHELSINTETSKSSETKANGSNKSSPNKSSTAKSTPSKSKKN